MDDYDDGVIYIFPKRERRWLWPYLAAMAILFVAVLLSCAVARAQQAPDPLQSLSLDWQALATAQGHVATGIQAIAAELTAARKKQADTEAYWKAWCGDPPGCAPFPPHAEK